MERKLVTEENYKKGSSKLKKIGKILLWVGAPVAVVGLILLIVGFSSFMSTEGATMGLFAGGGFLLVVGIWVLIIGVILMLVAHSQEINAFGASAVAPVVTETIDVVREGLSDKQNSKTATKCQKCGAENETGAKFCSSCGANLTAGKVCKKCNNKLSETDKFCPVCGEKAE